MSHALKAIEDLGIQDQMELVMFNQMPVSKTIYAVMDMVVELARDEAMSVPPEKRDERLAKMDVAFAANTLAQGFKDAIKFIAEKHYGETQKLANEKLLEDQEAIARIVLKQ